ncbi:hypothetical protein [Umezawaea sp. Da 62-37]|uniref:hypothetical protein n=1 Tax=Umezawaea sp. Da 62-37 TaxID=3075927 RepID=UPI0028F6E308|nr:hypothetical protein [Umezawaea sp. Da 62-37]WNV87051.1 hypothetical protein RM788_01810 [Umezawaea sp. Da 62-37]
MSSTAFSMPVEWRPHVHVRRDGGVRGDAVVEPGAVHEVRAVLAERSPAVEAVLDEPMSDQDLVAAVRAHLAGEATPLGAAVVAVLLGSEPRMADALVVEHGLPFAARAVVGMRCVEAHRNGYGNTALHLRRKDLDHNAAVGTARRLRSLLATASDEEYENALLAVELQRTALGAMAAASYLFPTRRDWVDDAFDEVERANVTGYQRVLAHVSLSYAVSTAAQVERALTTRAVGRYLKDEDALYTVLDGVGADALPAIAVLLEPHRELDGEVRDRVLETLVEFPTAEVFDALLARLEVKRVLPAVLDLARRYPVLALERFVASDDPRVEPLLERHLKGHPESADAPSRPTGSTCPRTCGRSSTNCAERASKRRRWTRCPRSWWIRRGWSRRGPSRWNRWWSRGSRHRTTGRWSGNPASGPRGPRSSPTPAGRTTGLR